MTKQMDGASPMLLQDALAGTMGNTVDIKFTTTTEGKTIEFAHYQLENTGISGYSVSSGGDKPSESLSLNFVKVLFDYKVYDDKLKPVSSSKVTYDLSKLAK